MSQYSYCATLIHPCSVSSCAKFFAKDSEGQVLEFLCIAKPNSVTVRAILSSGGCSILGPETNTFLYCDILAIYPYNPPLEQCNRNGKPSGSMSSGTSAQNESKSLACSQGVLVLTKKNLLLLLTLDVDSMGTCIGAKAINQNMKCVSKIDLQVPSGFVLETGPILTIDPFYRCLAVCLYERNVKIVPIDQKNLFKLHSSRDRRTPSLRHMAFLQTPTIESSLHAYDPLVSGLSDDYSPVLAVLYETKKPNEDAERYVQCVSAMSDVKVASYEQHFKVFPDSHYILPVKKFSGAFVVFGPTAGFYVSKKNKNGKHIPRPPFHFSLPFDYMVQSICQMDEFGYRWLLVDMNGRLSQLTVVADSPSSSSRPKCSNEVEDVVKSLEVLEVGVLSFNPSTIALLGQHSHMQTLNLFCGSLSSNSGVLRIEFPQLLNAKMPEIEMIQTTDDNMAPLLDLCLANLDKRGDDPYLITVGGHEASGCIRIIRRGMSLDVFSESEEKSVSRIFSMKPQSSHMNEVLVLTYSTAATRAFCRVDQRTAKRHLQPITGRNSKRRKELPTEDESLVVLKEIEISGWDKDAETLWCSEVLDSKFLLQVTHREVRCVSSSDFSLAAVWSPACLSSAAEKAPLIHLAHANRNLLILSLNPKHLLLCKIEEIQNSKSESAVSVNVPSNTKPVVKVIAEKYLEYEVSCLCLNPPFVALGFWGNGAIELRASLPIKCAVVAAEYSHFEADVEMKSSEAIATTATKANNTEDCSLSKLKRPLDIIECKQLKQSAEFDAWQNENSIAYNPTSSAADEDTICTSVALPTSIQILKVDKENLYLLVGTSDGLLISYNIRLYKPTANCDDSVDELSEKDVCNDGYTAGMIHTANINLEDRRTVSLGTHPITLIPVTQTSVRRSLEEYLGQDDSTDKPLEVSYVFATGDHPAVIHFNDDGLTPAKLSICRVNFSQPISYVAPFSLSLETSSALQGIDNAKDNTPRLQSLAWLTGDIICFGTIDNFSKLQTKIIPLGVSPERIVFDPSAGVALVGCTLGTNSKRHFNELLVSTNNSKVINTADDKQSGDGDLSLAQQPNCVLIAVDVTTEDLVANFRLPEDEHISSLLICDFGGSAIFLCLGTTVCLPDEELPKLGYLRLIEVTRRDAGPVTLTEVCKESVAGAVTSVAMIDSSPAGVEKLLVVGANHKVKLYALYRDAVPFRPNTSVLESSSKSYTSLSLSNWSLSCLATHSSHTYVYALDSWRNSLLVGDLQRSAGICEYNFEDKKLEEVARDWNNIWVMAVACLSQNYFAVADDSHNLVVLERCSTPKSDEDRAVLNQTGLFHLGQMVNRIVPLNDPSSSCSENSMDIEGPKDTMGFFGEPKTPQSRGMSLITPFSKTSFWVSAEGGIGCLISIKNEKVFARLRCIESALGHLLPSVGGLPHADWRSFYCGPHQTHESRHFIDGDMVERLVELPYKWQKKVSDRLKKTSGDDLQFGSLNVLLNEVNEIQRWR